MNNASFIVVGHNSSTKSTGNRVIVQNPIDMIEAVRDREHFNRIRIYRVVSYHCSNCGMHGWSRGKQCGYCGYSLSVHRMVNNDK